MTKYLNKSFAVPYGSAAYRDNWGENKMGMYDSVNFSCPHCGGNIEVQSKAGDCFLASYSPNKIPWDIAQDIEAEECRCSQCSMPWVVETRWTPPETTQCRLVKEW